MGRKIVENIFNVFFICLVYLFYKVMYFKVRGCGFKIIIGLLYESD